MLYQDILATIGHTPLVELRHLSPKPQVRIFALNGQVFGDFLAGDVNDNKGVRLAGGAFIGSPPGQLAIIHGPGDMPLVYYRRLDSSVFFP